jgi:hypothetical protein
MQYFVKGEFLDETVIGKQIEESLGWLERVVHPSLGMLAKAVEERKITGGATAGVRESIFILEAESNEDVGSFLRGLPFWTALKWTVTPLQSFKSVLEQDKVMFASTRQLETMIPSSHNVDGAKIRIVY